MSELVLIDQDRRKAAIMAAISEYNSRQNRSGSHKRKFMTIGRVQDNGPVRIEVKHYFKEIK